MVGMHNDSRASKMEICNVDDGCGREINKNNILIVCGKVNGSYYAM
jgi:hypothetical protein